MDTEAKKPKKKRRGRGEGSIEEVSPGRWRAILSLGVDPVTRKRKKRKFYAPTKKAALEKLRDEQAKRPTNASTLTLSQYLDQWLAGKKTSTEPNTYSYYETITRRHLKPRQVALRRLCDLTPRDALSLVAELQEAKVTTHMVRRTLQVLTTALRDAVSLELIPRNPVAGVKKPKSRPREIRPLTAEQARAVLAAAQGDRYEAYYWLALDAGCRPGELLGLHWPDVDTESRTVRIRQSLEDVAGALRLKEPKTPRGRRTLPITGESASMLAEHRERMAREGRDTVTGPVFVDKKGGLVLRVVLRNYSLLRIRRRSGVQFTFYDLRHSCASLLLAAGVNIRVVSERLGHERIEMTLARYCHLLPGMQDTAVTALHELFVVPQSSPQSPASPSQNEKNSPLR